MVPPRTPFLLDSWNLWYSSAEQQLIQQPEGRWAVRASENTEVPSPPARARQASPQRLHARRGLDPSYLGATAQGTQCGSSLGWGYGVLKGVGLPEV